MQVKERKNNKKLKSKTTKKNLSLNNVQSNGPKEICVVFPTLIIVRYLHLTIIAVVVAVVQITNIFKMNRTMTIIISKSDHLSDNYFSSESTTALKNI